MSSADDDSDGDHSGSDASPRTPEQSIRAEVEPSTPAVVRRMRRQLLSAVIVAAVSLATAAGSILGQGIAYRQMRAIEQIAQRCGR